MRDATEITFHSATVEDFPYVYALCEKTMRSYVEEDLGDCFEKVARPTIENLLKRGLFSKLYAHQALVGAVAYERQDAHIQLEELYVEPSRQNQGLGTKVMRHLLGQSKSLSLPIHLHVLLSNPARVFYERLGFTVTRSTAVVNFMEYCPVQHAVDA
jgi:ribosomal protein S18 acetylase RimI-like enzyme